MRIKSAMSHDFSHSPQANIPRSSFNRSFGHKSTFNAGLLIPIFLDEAYPGDTFHVNMTALARLATPIVPVMDNMFLDSQFFAVPMRLVWDHWQNMMGERRNPTDTIDYTTPQIVAPAVTGFVNGTLFDYFGLPTAVPGISISALYSRAYNLIWNEWYRDENLQNSVTVDLDDGPDDPADYVLLRRGKRYDYFTSCLPWAQKGDPVEFSGGLADVVLKSTTPTAALIKTYAAHTLVTSTNPLGTNAGGALADGVAHAAGYVIDPNGTLEADLTAITINQLREAFQIQKVLERDARGGTRYTEIIRSHFGVISPDARLQRPEFLGGGSSPISINPIAQTSSTDNITPQGNLAAIGYTTTKPHHGHGFTKSFTEHCIIVGLISVRADLNYQYGINRMFSRSTRYDYYLPALSHLGEQAVLNKEIYAQATSVDDDVFGYQERWAEMRYRPNQISGQFRSNFAQTLDYWHLAQKFTSLPVLNGTFIQENPPIERITAVTEGVYPNFLFDSHFEYRCARPLPLYSVPGLIDHF